MFLVLPNGDYSSISATQATGCTTVGDGNIMANGTNLQGSLKVVFDSADVGALQTAGCVFSDGSPDATGFINGALSQGSGINLMAFLTTENGTLLPTLTLNLPLSPLYAKPGPLSRLQGTYQVRQNEVLTIDANGVATLTGSPFGCTVNELYSQVGDGSHNIYTSSATYSGCASPDDVLNGQTVTGTFTLDDTVTPVQLIGVEMYIMAKDTYFIHFVGTKQ